MEKSQTIAPSIQQGRDPNTTTNDYYNTFKLTSFVQMNFFQVGEAGLLSSSCESFE